MSHTQLFKDLRFRGIVKQLMMSYRKQVKINNQLSTEKNMEFGTPQGTVLGRLLFVSYVNNKI